MTATNGKRMAGLVAAMSGLLAASAMADPRIEDVFQSTQDAMESGGDFDGRKVIAVVCGIVGLIVIIVVLNKFRSRDGGSKSLNHQGKLMRELQRELNIKPAEVRQLKALVDASPAENPLTFMICPSLLSRAVKDQPAKIDRKALAALAKRIAAPATAPKGA